jgi:aryl sulfotransferase
MTRQTLPTLSHIYQNHHLDSTRWKHFIPRKDDIVISTSYKSGTTWTQGILQQLIFLHQEVPPLDELSPWLERRRTPIDEVIRNLEAQQHRRFIKSHLALDGVPFYPQLKYLIVARDARDVFMSLWNHYSNYTPDQYANLNDNPGRVGPPLPHSPADIHEFYQNWMTRGWFPWESEGYPFWGNLHHTATWWEYRHLENILFVHYADMLHDLPAEIGRIADFLDIPVSAGDLQQIARSVSLPEMRREAEQTDAGLVKSFKGGAETFFFKGTNGRWTDILTSSELEIYQRKASALLPPAALLWLEHGRKTLT